MFENVSKMFENVSKMYQKCIKNVTEMSGQGCLASKIKDVGQGRQSVLLVGDIFSFRKDQ